MTEHRKYYPTFFLAVSLFLGAMPANAVAAEPVQWGTPVSGLRLGIAIKHRPGGHQIHTFFQNLSKQQIDVFVGTQYVPGGGCDYQVKALGPRGERYNIDDFYPCVAGHLVKVGLSTPIFAAIPPGESYETSDDAAGIAYYPRGGRVPLEDLLNRGFKVQVEYEVKPSPPGWAMTYAHPDIWYGKIISGEVSISAEAH